MEIYILLTWGDDLNDGRRGQVKNDHFFLFLAMPPGNNFSLSQIDFVIPVTFPGHLVVLAQS